MILSRFEAILSLQKFWGGRMLALVSSLPHTPAPKSSAKPRRDIVGFLKSIVEFFTSLAGMIAAGLATLGTLLAIVLAPGTASTPANPVNQGDPRPAPTNLVPPPAPVTTVPGVDDDADYAAWSSAVNDICAAAVPDVTSGDPLVTATAFRAVAFQISALAVPSAHAESVAAVVNDFERAAAILDGTAVGSTDDYQSYVRDAIERTHAFGATRC